jgi:hypothetical protein
MKRLLPIILLAAPLAFASCELPNPCDEGYTARTKTEYEYHYGYNYASGKYEYHFGPVTKTYCYEDK